MKTLSLLLTAIAVFLFTGCKQGTCSMSILPGAISPAAPVVVSAPATNSIPPREQEPGLRRSTYTPRVYPVDERGFSPVDKALAKAYAREDIVTNDDEGALNPFVLKVISGYPLDGSYQYHCSWKPWEYDITLILDFPSIFSRTHQGTFQRLSCRMLYLYLYCNGLHRSITYR